MEFSINGVQYLYLYLFLYLYYVVCNRLGQEQEAPLLLRKPIVLHFRELPFSMLTMDTNGHFGIGSNV